MWSRRSRLLGIRVRLRGRHRIRLCLTVGLYVLLQTLLSFDALLSLLPGRFGRMIRSSMDTVQGVLLAMSDAEPQTFVHAEIEEEKQQVYVDIKTTDWIGGDKK